MKKIISLFILSSLLSCNNDDDNSNSTPCIISGTIQLETQAQVDAFVASNYCTVSGKFMIGSYYNQTDITDISGLENLIDVGGELIIQGNSRLTSLEGLHNLKHAKSVLIRSNSIKDLKGLRSFESLYDDQSGSLLIVDNPSLKNIDGLESFKAIPSLSIYNNAVLENISGLKNLAQCGYISIGYCPKLTSLEGFGSPAVGTLDILHSNLISLAGLETVAVENLYLHNNEFITSLQGFNASALKSLDIQYNPNLASIQALQNLPPSIDYFTLLDCPKITSLTGLEGATTIKNISIRENDGLTSLQGLQNLQTIGFLEIIWNQSLTTIQQLSSVTAMIDSFFQVANEGNIIIQQNHSLTSLNGLQNINPYTVNSLYANYNTSLQNLCDIIIFTQTPGVYVQLENNANPVDAYEIDNSNCN